MELKASGFVHYNKICSLKSFFSLESKKVALPFRLRRAVLETCIQIHLDTATLTGKDSILPDNLF